MQPIDSLPYSQWSYSVTFFPIHFNIIFPSIGEDAIAQSVHRRATFWNNGIWLPVAARCFSLIYNTQAGSGAHPASCPVETGG
jgi:hypothetical protein